MVLVRVCILSVLAAVLVSTAHAAPVYKSDTITWTSSQNYFPPIEDAYAILNITYDSNVSFVSVNNSVSDGILNLTAQFFSASTGPLTEMSTVIQDGVVKVPDMSFRLNTFSGGMTGINNQSLFIGALASVPDDYNYYFLTRIGPGDSGDYRFYKIIKDEDPIGVLQRTYGSSPYGFSFTSAVVPETGTLALVLAGGIGAYGIRLRRRKA